MSKNIHIHRSHSRPTARHSSDITHANASNTAISIEVSKIFRITNRFTLSGFGAFLDRLTIPPIILHIPLINHIHHQSRQSLTLGKCSGVNTSFVGEQSLDLFLSIGIDCGLTKVDGSDLIGGVPFVRRGQNVGYFERVGSRKKGKVGGCKAKSMT